MPRHTKKKTMASIGYINSPKVTIDLEDSDAEPPRDPPVTYSTKKQKKRGRKADKRKIAKGVTLDTPEDSSTDELAVEQQIAVKPSGKSFPFANSGREKEVIRAVGKATKILLALGDQVEVNKIIQSATSCEDATFNKIREDCTTISNLLPVPASAPAPAQQAHSQVPSTIHLYDQYFVHQGIGRQLFVLRPVEVFQGRLNLTRRKVLGFVQHKGSNFPLKFALPGWTPAVEDHPKFLDSHFWTVEVQRWGEFHNHVFPTHQFDEHHGKVRGHACASHVEPRLMLWYACDRLRELRGVDKPIRNLLGELFRLRDYNVKMEAEIFLTRDACKKCEEIKNLIEEYTRIKFQFKSAKTLGELQLEKDKRGSVTFPRYAQVNEDEEDNELEVIEREEVVEKTKSTFAVVIRGSPNTPVKKTSKSNTQGMTPPSTSSTITKTKTSMMTQKRKIRNFSYQPSRPLTTVARHQAEVDSDSETSDYQPRASIPRKSKSISNSFERLDQDEDLHGSTEPDVGPFGHEAQRRANLLRKERKRKADENASPSLRKKPRHTKF